MSFYGNNTLIRLSVCSQNLCSASKTRCYVFLNLPVVKYSLHHLILPFSCEKLIAFICYRFFFYWKQWTQPRNRWWGGSKFVKSEKSSGLLPPPLSSKDNIEHRDGEKGRVLSLENSLTGSWSNGGPKAAHVTDSASCNVHRSGDRS